ncbi:ferritin-like domain-containing protein [Pendulispora brunnea]|uniref:Ferritin-like domain-containing protein n=1 Tax=Pendulispora brunnea TaxID=2905690 RepID=A0ABZ2K5I5_9BACT
MNVVGKSTLKMGLNRTGMATSPIHGKELVDSVSEATPSSTGDEQWIAAVRNAYGKEGLPVGHVPAPSTLKGVVGTTIKAVQGLSMTVFMDKLGERLAFERTGTRLYEALLSKFDTFGTFAGGPQRSVLERFHQEELTHFSLLKSTIESLGGDPTVITPSADVVAVESMGLAQVLLDPRTTFVQGLEAILVAELADNDGWTLLITLAGDFNREDLVQSFKEALDEENAHLEKVRHWVRAAMRVEEKVKD